MRGKECLLSSIHLIIFQRDVLILPDLTCWPFVENVSGLFDNTFPFFLSYELYSINFEFFNDLD